MASVSKKGTHYFIRVYIGGKPKKLYGFTNKREAERVGEKIEMLIAARKTGETPPELAVWTSRLAESDSDLYVKLAKFSLVDSSVVSHTLGELFEKCRESRQDVTESTAISHQTMEANLAEFFGAACDVKEITVARAYDYAKWLRTTPLNRRRKQSEPVPYSEATVNRRIKRAKQVFTQAKRLGWVAENPFAFIKGGESVNPLRWAYVDAEAVLQVISASHLPKWRAIIALGRFAGIRGSSELYGLLWEHIRWSCPDEPGQIVIMAVKNKRHGRQFRTIPLHPVAERELAMLFKNAREGETHVFPGMKKQTNFRDMTERMTIRAGLPLWPNIWYNLRKSFCSDLMETGLDPVVYESITDHSYAVAMKHYQIHHAKQLQTGYEKIFDSWGLKNRYENIPETLENPSNAPFAGGLKKGLVGGLKRDLRGITPTGEKSQRDSQVPIFSGFSQETRLASRVTQTGGLIPAGLRTLIILTEKSQNETHHHPLFIIHRISRHLSQRDAHQLPRWLARWK